MRRKWARRGGSGGRDDAARSQEERMLPMMMMAIGAKMRWTAVRLSMMNVIVEGRYQHPQTMTSTSSTSVLLVIEQRLLMPVVDVSLMAMLTSS